MRWSATRVRWVLLVGVFLLATVVAGFFGLARYRAGKIWQRILARNGVNLQRETNGFTWSQSSKGRTIFTVHASKATPKGPNKYALHDAVLILYGREPGRDDRIYGSDFEYDQEAGVARALGEVHMDLQTPEPGGRPPVAGAKPDLGFGRADAAANDPTVIHVRTSGLVYMRKLGLAATGEPTEFRYGGITCTSRGAEFDSEHSLVRLLAEVRMSGTAKGTSFQLTAGHAELDRAAYTADLTLPVMSSGDRGARAAHALLHLRKDGSVQAADATGAFEMHTAMETVTAPQMTATFGKENRPEHAQLFTGVTYNDRDGAEPAHAVARTVDLAWDPAGELRKLTAEGAVSYLRGEQGGSGQSRLRAEQLLADFVPGAEKRSELRRVHMTGGAELASSSTGRGADVKAGQKPREVKVRGDELVTEFGQGAQGKTVPKVLTGIGHTKFEQLGTDGAHQQSTGETLEMSFAPGTADGNRPGPLQVSSATQSGSVAIESQAAPAGGKQPAPTTGRAVKAVYTEADAALRLTGSGVERAFVQQTDGQVSADEMVLHQGSGDAEMSGHVVVTSLGANGSAGTHVLASRARLLHAAGISEFEGDPGSPAQLWQGGSQVRADRIFLDDKRHTMSARPAEGRGLIQAVFASSTQRSRGGPQAGASISPGSARLQGEEAKKGSSQRPSSSRSPEAEQGALEVSASRMDYDDTQHEAVFAGGVRLNGAVGEASSERAVAFLKDGRKERSAARGTTEGLAAIDLGGTLDRFVMLGAVQVKQPGRLGTGEQLLYTATTGTFALTGTASQPPKVTAEGGTVVTGATLLFQNVDSTIVVAGAKGDSKAQGPARVHTELDLKQ